MTAPVLDFNFYVTNIERAIVAKLKTDRPYARDIVTYSGDLDAKDLRDALEELSPRFPLYLVSYTNGKSVDRGGVAPDIGAPRERQHNCSFVVLACDDNARGEEERRHGRAGEVGVYQMISDAVTSLSRMQLSVTVEGVSYQLNPEPLNESDIDRIAQLPQHTAYAVYFDTYFVYLTPDRRGAGQQVSEIVIDIDPNGETRNQPQRPGVIMQ
jgi:phage gp37-like protein